MKQKKVFYAGNMLSKFGKNPTSVEILGESLKERYEMILVSGYRNQFIRLVHMLVALTRQKAKVGLVLIDTYSGLGFYYSLLLAMLARMCSLPYIPILRGGNLETRLRRNPALSAMIFEKCYVSVAPSFFMSSLFSKYGYSNTIVIPNSIRIADYKFVKRQEFGTRLLWVRSLKDIYRPDIALEVLSILSAKFPVASLCLVGPDPDNRLEICLTLAKRLAIADRVIFAGKLTKSKWHELATAYDIFLNTSSIDNTPVTLVEAMALGLPVVSTDVGGIRYLLNNEIEGLLIKDLNPEEMANQVERLVRDPELGRLLAMNARRKVEGYSWELVRNEWFKLIDNVL